MNKCSERVNDRHFWNPGVFSYGMIPRCRPNSTVCLFNVASIVQVRRGQIQSRKNTYCTAGNSVFQNEQLTNSIATDQELGWARLGYNLI